jgi:UDP-2,3-diacylglucosamine pyrophosphatase LpxH
MSDIVYKILPVELSEEFDELELYAVADVHIGERESRLEDFERFIDFILDKPNRYVLILGDIINNNLKNSVGSVYEDTIPPSQQKKKAKQLLKRLQSRIIAIVSGNHEFRSHKDTDQDITEDIAEYLDVPYSPDVIYIKLTFGKKQNGKRQCYTIYATHGFAGGRTPGNALNRLEDLSKNIEAEIYIVGHTHKKIAHKAMFHKPDLQNNVIREVEQLFINTASWVSYGGYAKRKGMRPQARGAAPIKLGGREKYIEGVV